MSVIEALERAVGGTNCDDVGGQLQAEGLAVADTNSLSRAIHEIYCGVMADHHEPNEKDREQARALLGSLQRHSG
jgi:hypothetical protein